MMNSINGLGFIAPSTALPANVGSGADTDASQAGFSTFLSNFLANSVDTIKQGEAAAVAGLTGTAPLQEVVQKVMAAEQAMQAGIALRDKIVSAYLEVSRMSI